MLRKAVRRLLTRPAPLAVVVVLGPRQERFLASCLETLPGGAEVVVAPWGGPVPATPPVRPARVLAPEQTGNDARNAGVAATTRDLVLFVDASDRLVPGAVDALISRLGDNAVVIGRGHALAQTPAIFRRDGVPRFDPAHGRFPQMSLPSRPAVDVALLEDGGSPWAVPFGTVPPASGELAGFAALVDAGAGETWLPDLLAAWAPAFLDDLEHAAPADVAALAAAVDGLTDAVLADIDVETRLRLWLVGRGEHRAMNQFTVQRWFTSGQFATRVADGHVEAVLPVPEVEVPAHVLRVPVHLEASLRRAVPVEDGWRLTVFAGLRRVDLGAHPPTLTARMLHESGEEVSLPVVQRPDPEATRFFGMAHQNHDAGAVELELVTTRLPRAGRWHLEVELQVPGIRRSGPITHRDEHGSAGVLGLAPGGRAQASFDPALGLVVVVGAPAATRSSASGEPLVEEVRRDTDLVLMGRGGAAAVRFELCRGAQRVPAETERAPDGTFTARFPLSETPWGFPARSLPLGTWHVAWSHGRERGELTLAPQLVARTPLELGPDPTEAHRVRVLRGLRGQVLVELRPPLADDELGPWAQQELRAAYAVTDRPLDHTTVLFRSYAGTAVTDSPLAIHDELRARRPDLRALWVVADHSVLAPDGAEPVLFRSRAFYDALGTAGTVVTNVEMDRFFRTRPGQRLVQTFHGYPSKAMGLDLWRSKNHGPIRLQLQLANTSRNWSVALTPTPEMDRYYREQYSYDGVILNHGYPRDDALVGPSAGVRREEARRRLGIADGRTAVLYAPTWRDDLATNFRAAPLVSHLDVAEAARALGDDYVLMLRGHRFHPRQTGARARVLDVTGYPEINDLVLAADVTVLDYSSLRFDVALTNRPMVFLVPDLEDYAGTGRGFLYPFTDSTPGPLVSSTAEVVEHLRDLPGLTATYAGELARFNATYNSHQDGHAAARVVDHLWG